MYKVLDNHNFLDLLDDETKFMLIDRGRIRTLETGAMLHTAGDFVDHMTIILEGRVSFSRLDASGNTLQYLLLGKGESFGLVALMTGRGRTHDAHAISNVRLLYIRKSLLLQMMDEFKSIRMLVLQTLSKQLSIALETLQDERTLSLKDRLKKRLRENADSDGVVHFTQTQIAEYLSVSRNSVGTALKALEAEKFIKIQYGKVFLNPSQDGGIELKNNQKSDFLTQK